MRVAVIGAGNGGQAMAGHLALVGHSVAVFDLNRRLSDEIEKHGGIHLKGCLEGFGRIDTFARNLREAVDGAEVIMITTTACAHRQVAMALSDILADGQMVVLNPGRTGGALEFQHTLREIGSEKQVLLAEAQTLVYACRMESPGVVNLIGVKKRVLVSALPARHTSEVLTRLEALYDCFVAAPHVLHTSLENIGAVFHPSVVLFNAATIERGVPFYFYRDMTPRVAQFVESLDAERLAVGRAFGLQLMSARDWVSSAYGGVCGDSLCERMQSNPAYYDILAPTSLDCRQLLEDLPTGFVPMLALGRLAGVQMPRFEAVLLMCSTLLEVDFLRHGRTLERMGLAGCRPEDVLARLI